MNVCAIMACMYFLNPAPTSIAERVSKSNFQSKLDKFHCSFYQPDVLHCSLLQDVILDVLHVVSAPASTVLLDSPCLLAIVLVVSLRVHAWVSYIDGYLQQRGSACVPVLFALL